MTQCLRRVAWGWKVSVVFSILWKADVYWATSCYFVHSLTARQEWLDSRRYAVLPYIYRHGFGKAVHRISNHGRTLFGHGGQSHGTHVMEASSYLHRTNSSHFRRNTWDDAPTAYGYNQRKRQRDEQNPCNGWTVKKVGWSIWTDYIIPVRHVLKVNRYGGRQAKMNEKSLCFKGWETLVCN